MNIVYALSGEGRGHGSLARAILPVLQQAGHKCKIFTYGQSLGQLDEYDVVPIRGIKHYYDPNGRLSLMRSVVKNAGVLFYYASHWKAVRRQVRDFAPDLFIINFEPFMPLIARSLDVPVLSFDNQHALLHLAERLPGGIALSAWATQTAIRCVAPWAEHYVVFTFAAIYTNSTRVHVVPPVVNAEIKRIAPTVGSHVLVYLKQPNARLIEILKQTEERFVVYGYNVADTDRNLTFRVFNRNMPAELGAAKAVMGTAGMSLVSESVFLKKPFFGIPLKNEFEQMVNARAIKGLDFGDFAEEPAKEQIEHFFANLGRYRRSLNTYHFDPDAAARKLLQLIGATRVPRGGH